MSFCPNDAHRTSLIYSLLINLTALPKASTQMRRLRITYLLITAWSFLMKTRPTGSFATMSAPDYSSLTGEFPSWYLSTSTWIIPRFNNSMPSTIIRSQDIQMCIDNGSKFLRFVYVVVLMTWTEISDDDTLRFAIFPRTSLNLRLRHLYSERTIHTHSLNKTKKARWRSCLVMGNTCMRAKRRVVRRTFGGE